MKKLLIVIPAIAMLAAGCGGSAQNATTETPATNSQNNATTSSQPGGNTQENKNNAETTPPNTVATSGNRTATNSDLKISAKYPSDWTVEEQKNMAGPVVSFFPPKAVPQNNYLTITYDTRSFKTIDEIKTFYKNLEKQPATTNTWAFAELSIGGNKAYSFANSAGMADREIYIFHNGRLYNITTSEFLSPGVQEIINSITFTK